MTYFFCKRIGLKADIKRHMDKEAELRAKIAEVRDKDDKESKTLFTAYIYFLGQLLASKAEITGKIGKKKC